MAHRSVFGTGGARRRALLPVPAILLFALFSCSSTPPQDLVEKNRLDLLKARLEAGMSPDVRNQWGATLLHLAALNGNVPMVRLLLDYGADPNARQSQGATPLHLAAHEGHLEVVRLLLERGADPTIRHKGGETPLQVALRRGHKKVAKLLESARSHGGR